MQLLGNDNVTVVRRQRDRFDRHLSLCFLLQNKILGGPCKLKPKQMRFSGICSIFMHALCKITSPPGVRNLCPWGNKRRKEFSVSLLALTMQMFWCMVWNAYTFLILPAAFSTFVIHLVFPEVLSTESIWK